MKPCPSRKRLEKYLTDSLSQAERNSLQEHLGACEDCQRWLDRHQEQEPTSASSESIVEMREGDHSEYDARLIGRIERAFQQATGAPSEVGLGGSLTYLGPIGRGGLGEVHAYEDKRLNRKVAVKLIRGHGINAQRLQERFEREYRITSNLEHPGVAPIYAAGRTPEGVPFYVMRYVQGKSLQQTIRDLHELRQPLVRGNVAFRDLLNHFRAVCETIAYAHEQGVLHRDLKPENVKVGDQGTVVLDWGVAKWIGEPDDANQQTQRRNILETAAGASIGTPVYMSPEQAAGDLDAVDHRSDIYGLGAVLFEVLTNRPPHAVSEEEQNQQRGQIDWQARIQENPTPDALHYNPAAPRELASLCAAAMAGDPKRRIACAKVLSEQVELWLVRDTLAYHHYSPTERGVRFLSAHLRGFASVLLGLCLVIAILLGSNAAVQASRDSERKQRRIADQQRKEAVLQQRVAERRRSLADVLRAQIAHQLGQSSIEVGDSQAARDALSLASDTVSWDTRYLRRLAAPQLVPSESFADGYWGFLAMASTANGTKVVTADAGGELVIWDMVQGSQTRRLLKGRYSEEERRSLHFAEQRPPETEPHSWGECPLDLAWLPDEVMIAAASLDGAAVLYDSRSGERSIVAETGDPLLAVASRNDSDSLVFGSVGGNLYHCSREKGLLNKYKKGSAVTDIVWVPTPGRWCCAFKNGQVSLLDSETFETKQAFSLAGPVHAVACGAAPAAILLAAAPSEGGPILYRYDSDAHQFRHPKRLPLPSDQGGDGSLSSLAFSADSSLLVGVDEVGRLLVWDTATHRLKAVLRLVNPGVRMKESLPQAFHRRSPSVHVLPGKKELLVAGNDGNLRRVKLALRESTLSRRSTTTLGPSPHLAFSNGSPPKLWAINVKGALTVIDASTEEVIDQKANAHEAGVSCIARSTVGSGVLTSGADGAIRSWKLTKDSQIGEAGKLIQAGAPILGIDISPNGKWVAGVDATSNVMVWRLKTGELLYKNSVSTGHPLTGRVAFGPLGQTLAAFGAGQSCCVYYCNTVHDRFRKAPDQARVAGAGGVSMLWNPKLAGYLVTSDEEGNSRLEESVFLQPVAFPRKELPRLQTVCIDMAATDDAQRFILLESTGRLTFVDSQFGETMLTLPTGLVGSSSLAVDPSGRLIAVATRDGDMALLDSGSEETPAPPDAEEITADWKGVDLLDRSSAATHLHDRCVALSKKGECAIVYTQSIPDDANRDGALYYAREGARGVTTQRIRPGTKEHHRRVEYETIALAMVAGDSPVVCCRVRHAELSPYDGSMCLSRPKGLESWEVERLHDHGNLGFYPYIALGQSKEVEGIAHFTFDGKYLLWSSRKPDRTWSYRTIGRQGDGFRLSGVQDRSGQHHLVFRNLAFNGGPVRSYYMRWSGNPDAALRERLPHGPMQIELGRNGDPFVLKERPHRRVIMRRQGDQWTRFQELKFTANVGPPFAADRDGALHLLRWHADREQLLLYRKTTTAWTREVVASGIGESTRPNFGSIRFNEENRPVIIVGRVHRPYSWLKVYRNTTSL